MYRRLLSSFAMLCCAAAFVSANAQDSNLQSLLDSKDKQIDDAIIKGDLTPVRDLFSSSATIITPLGGVAGIEDFSALLKSGTLKYTSIEVSEEKLSVCGNVAIRTFLSNDTGTMQGHDISSKIRRTEVWAQQAGQWKIIAAQSTPIVPGS